MILRVRVRIRRKIERFWELIEAAQLALKQAKAKQKQVLPSA